MTVWRYRLVAAAAAVSFLAFAAFAYLSPSGTASTSGVLPDLAAGLVLLGWGAAVVHGLVEQRQAPVNAAEVLERQRRLLHWRRLSTMGFTGGLLVLLAVTTDSPPLALTALVLLIGLLHKPAARTRKVATVLARDLDAVLRLYDLPRRDRKTNDWVKACDDLLLSGGSGLNSGVALGWWAAPALHPALQQQLRSHRNRREQLPDDLHTLLVAHRAALTHLLDVAA